MIHKEFKKFQGKARNLGLLWIATLIVFITVQVLRYTHEGTWDLTGCQILFGFMIAGDLIMSVFFFKESWRVFKDHRTKDKLARSFVRKERLCVAMNITIFLAILSLSLIGKGKMEEWQYWLIMVALILTFVFFKSYFIRNWYLLRRYIPDMGLQKITPEIYQETKPIKAHRIEQEISVNNETEVKSESLQLEEVITPTQD